MNNTLVLPDGVDKLSTSQKAVALGVLGVVGYLVLPFILTLMVNLTMVILLGIPLAFIAYNYEIIWSLFKTLSWKFTQSLIGLDPISMMERYHEWVKGKHLSIQNAKVNLQSTLNTLNQQIEEKDKSYLNNMNKALKLNEQNRAAEAQLYSSNGLSDKEFINSLVPLRDNVEVKVTYLSELNNVFELNTKQLGYKIENLKLQYKTLQDTHKGMKSANDVIGDAGFMNKAFKNSVEQANQQMNLMTANIQQFEENIKPMLSNAKLDQELHQQEAMKLLEDFKKTQFELQK